MAKGASRGATKRCFVVSEFGSDEQTRLERKQTLKHLIKRVLEPMGYEVQRADDIDDLGQITHQIIERLIDDDLVVADLTGLNPNVFYELAVRHAARKPVVTLMTYGERIPFDLKDVRTVFYDLHDPDKLEAAQEDLTVKVKALEANPHDIRNPITVARNVTLLQESEDPDVQATGALLEAVNDLRDEMRALGRRVVPTEPSGERRNAPVSLRVQSVIQRSDRPLKASEVAQRAGIPTSAAKLVLDLLADDPDDVQVFRVEGGYSNTPF